MKMVSRRDHPQLPVQDGRSPKGQASGILAVNVSGRLIGLSFCHDLKLFLFF